MIKFSLTPWHQKVLFFLFLIGFFACEEQMVTPDESATFNEIRTTNTITPLEPVKNGRTNNNCPQSINIVHIEQCADFMVSLTNTHQVDNVNWYYSIGPHSHVYFGASTNPNGNGSINTPFYLNGSWDDYILFIYAEATLDNGVVCEEASGSLRLDCDEVTQINY